MVTAIISNDIQCTHLGKWHMLPASRSLQCCVLVAYAKRKKSWRIIGILYLIFSSFTCDMLLKMENMFIKFAVRSPNINLTY